MTTYTANYDVGEFLEARGFEPLSTDYRYYYFDDTEALQDELDEMPPWSYLWFANGW